MTLANAPRTPTSMAPLADEMLSASRSPGPGQARFRIGTGLQHGDVFRGIVGTAERREFTVLGDTVTVAFRIEQAPSCSTPTRSRRKRFWSRPEPTSGAGGRSAASRSVGGRAASRSMLA